MNLSYQMKYQRMFRIKKQLICLYDLKNRISSLLQIIPASTSNQPSYQMPHQIQLLPIWEVYFHDMAYPKQYLETMGPNIVHMNLRNFPNHEASYTRHTPVPSSLRVMGLWRELCKPLKKPYENADSMIVTHTQPCQCYAQPKTALVNPPPSCG